MEIKWDKSHIFISTVLILLYRNTYVCLEETHLTSKVTNRLNVKVWKVMCHADIQKRPEMAIVMKKDIKIK